MVVLMQTGRGFVAVHRMWFSARQGLNQYGLALLKDKK